MTGGYIHTKINSNLPFNTLKKHTKNIKHCKLIMSDESKVAWRKF